MGDVDRDGTRDLNASLTRISFPVVLFHQATHICALWSSPSRPERPKKNSHVIRREKCVIRSHFDLLKGTASDEDRPISSGIRK